MKIAISITSALLSIYAGITSYLVAHVGALYQIPQLEGDGGGGLVVAALCFAAASLIFFRVWFAFATYCFGAVAALFVGLSFQDGMVDIWSGVISLFAIASAILMWREHRRPSLQASPGDGEKPLVEGKRILGVIRLSKVSR